MLEILHKYRHFLLPMSLVLMFDGILLTMNYVISAQLETSSVNINIAGRQRMLSQKMSKDVMLLEYQQRKGEPQAHSKAELADAMLLFDQTLNAFSTGGIVPSASGEAIVIRRQAEKQVLATLTQAKHLWEPLYAELNKVLTDDVDVATLFALIAERNLPLLSLMNTLTNQLEQQARQQTYVLRALQTVIVIMILLSFALAIRRLFRREQYYQNLMEKSSDIVVGINARSASITFISASVRLMLGNEALFYTNKPINHLFTPDSVELVQNLLHEALTTQGLTTTRCEVHLLRHDGSTVVAEMLMQLASSEDGKAIELCADIRDISERKEMEQTLQELAHRDALTGLPNRMMFSMVAEQAINLARRQGGRVALMFIDLDDFKAVNDRDGHHIGDKLLVEVARRIQMVIRASDSVARLGGDEFVVLIEGAAGEEDIAAIAKKILRELSTPIVLDGTIRQIGASIGIACYPGDGQDIETLLKAADKGMYQVKARGKNGLQFVA